MQRKCEKVLGEVSAPFTLVDLSFWDYDLKDDLIKISPDIFYPGAKCPNQNSEGKPQAYTHISGKLGAEKVPKNAVGLCV